jgi:hypothetical protein
MQGIMKNVYAHDDAPRQSPRAAAVFIPEWETRS